MKKIKNKAVVKEQKKAAKKELTDQIIGALRSVIINFAANSKKIEKLIDKNAKQLVNKLSKEKIAKPVRVEEKVESSTKVESSKAKVENSKVKVESPKTKAD